MPYNIYLYMARIGIDIREAINTKKTGKGVYAENITKNIISKLKAKDTLFLFSDSNSESIPKCWLDNKNIKLQKINFEGISWHKEVAKLSKSLKLTHYFSPTSYVSPYYISKLCPKTKILVTVHDLIVFKFSKGHPLKPTLIEKYYLKKLVNTENITFTTVSKATQQDLISKFANLDIKNKSFVATNGVQPKNIKLKPNTKNPFILSVSTVLPRKNFLNLVKAFDFVKDQIPHKLVIIGGYKDSDLKQIKKYITSKNLTDRVNFLGFVSQEDLDKKYSTADMLVIPSLYEGFGLPVLEGLKVGLQVLCSDITPFKEVGGDVAIYFNPENPIDIANQIMFLSQNKEQKEIFAIEGPKQASKFSWVRSANKIYKFLSS